MPWNIPNVENPISPVDIIFIQLICDSHVDMEVFFSLFLPIPGRVRSSSIVRILVQPSAMSFYKPHIILSGFYVDDIRWLRIIVGNAFQMMPFWFAETSFDFQSSGPFPFMGGGHRSWSHLQLGSSHMDLQSLIDDHHWMIWLPSK